MISNARPASPVRRHPIQITKEGLGIKTQKSILYLDQNFFSSLYRDRNPQWKSAMERITELLDLQLIAIPYSPTNEAEADFYKDRDDLVMFIYGQSRVHRFEPLQNRGDPDPQGVPSVSRKHSRRLSCA